MKVKSQSSVGQKEVPSIVDQGTLVTPTTRSQSLDTVRSIRTFLGRVESHDVVDLVGTGSLTIDLSL